MTLWVSNRTLGFHDVGNKIGRDGGRCTPKVGAGEGKSEGAEEGAGEGSKWTLGAAVDNTVGC